MAQLFLFNFLSAGQQTSDNLDEALHENSLLMFSIRQRSEIYLQNKQPYGFPN
jgi:hypothetical protein